jgi:serine/threonine-protein kinase
MLAADAQSGGFLSKPADDLAAAAVAARETRSLIGQRVSHYEVISLLGAGGMGEVYRARDSRLGREVAVKVSAERFEKRFEQEARLIASLNHPNICTLHDVGPNYLVMELVEGPTLAERIKHGVIPLAEALDIAKQIANALEAAHARGIIHRDLKPANIKIKADGAVKVLDFGLAKLMTDSETDVTKTIEGTVLGTAAYMAPEQAEGKPLDERSDVFSFGAVLYEMLSGKRAFGGNSTAQVLSAVLRDDPSPFQAPAELQRVVRKCLAKQPKDRFPGMGALRVALEQISLRPVEQQPSIAVLPFANMSADKESEYFSDGLAEEILNLLAKIPGLKVIARTSAFAFKGKNEDIRKIAETLGVSNVLEGSVRRAGDRLRITTQLINAVDGSHLWSERYDRDLTDIFAIQDEIGQAISEALKVRLAPRAQTVNIEAYQNYLKGQYYRVRYTPESLAKAKECFEQALAIDPKYALAYSGLAEYYYGLAAYGIKPTTEVAALAKSFAERALAIDPANSVAHSVLAALAAICDYDWKSAERHFRKAMAAEPAPPAVRYRYALLYLLPLGRVREAMEQSRLALETDPLSMFLHFGMAYSIYAAKQYRETIEYARRALEIDANFYLIWFVMGLAQLGTGFTQESVASLKRVVELAPWWHMGVGPLAAAYYKDDDHERSQELARKLADSHSHTFGAAIYYAACGKVDAMFEALEGAHRQRDLILLYIQYFPFFDPYLADPRFQALLRRMDLA